MRIDPGNELARKKQTLKLLFNKALAEENAGNYKKALEYYRMSLQIDNRFFDSWLNAGAVYSKTGKSDKAKYCYEKAIASRPDPRAYYNLASMYFREEKYDKVKETLTALLKKDSRFLPAHLLMGYTCGKTGENDKAEIYIKNVLKLDPENKAALTALALMYYDEEKDHLALRYAERILTRYPQDLVIQRLKSNIFLRKGNEKESIYTLKNIADKDPKLEKIYRQLESEENTRVKEKITSKKKETEKKQKKDKQDWFDLSIMNLLDGNPQTAMDYLLNAIEKV